MNKQIKRYCVTVIMVFVIYCIYNPIAYALIAHNWRECVSAPGCTCVTMASTSTLKTYIVASTGFFLNSHSSYQAFLNRVEMTDLKGADYNEMRELLYNAIDSMKKARAAYARVKRASKKIPYDQVMIDRLQKFDYEGFQAKYGLLEPIFEKVKSLLAKGDIDGLDDATLSNMDSILRLLNQAKAAIKKGQSPDIELLWRINQEYLESQLFGQYMSEVFKANLGL